MKRNDIVAGVVGLGNMGLAVATRLAGLGPVGGVDPDAARQAAATARGIAVMEDLAALAATNRPILLSLPNPKVSHEVVGRLAGLLAPGSLIVETSTVTPADARAMHARCTEAGIGFVEAAILSGVELMEKGGSALLIGGEADAVARARPLLDALTPRQDHLGGPGAGAAAKVINNAVAHAVYVVLAEANAMANACGITTGKLVELLRGADAGLMRPLTHRIGERLARGKFEGGMPTEAARKDSVLALAVAQESGVPLFAIQAAHTVYELACARGLGRLDYAAVATLWQEGEQGGAMAGATEK